MRRVLKYKYYNSRGARPRCYRVKILNSKKQKWKLFIKKQSWFVKKLLRRAKWLRKNKKKITYFRRRKKSARARFKRKSRRSKKKIKNHLKTRVKRGRWLRLKKVNAAFFFRRIFYINYEKFFSQSFLKVEVENTKNKHKLTHLKSFWVKPLFNYSVLLFQASLLSTIHESTSHLRAGYALENGKLLKYADTLTLGNLYSVSSGISWKLSTPLKFSRKKYNRKALLLLFTEIDYYTKSFIVIKDREQLKNRECSLLVG